MYEESNREDRSIEAVVRWAEQARAEDAAVGSPLADADGDAQEIREHLELLGLLAYQLDEEVPAPETRSQLLASVGDRLRSSLRSTLGSAEIPQSSMTQSTMAPSAVPPAAMPPAVMTPSGMSPSEAPSVAAGLLGQASDRAFDEVTLQERRSEAHRHVEPGQGAVVGGAERFAQERREPAAPVVVRRDWLTGLMAASLAFCLLGMGYLAGRSSEQQSTIARLDQELTRMSQVDAQPVAGMFDELTSMQRKFNMITRVAHRAYPMETVAPVEPGSPRPDGMIYVCGAHQRWYLNVEGLAPPPPGQEYRLWFLTEKGPVAGGNLDVESGLPAEREDQSMPVGTRGFSITLESIDDPADQPDGMMVLLGEDSVRL